MTTIVNVNRHKVALNRKLLKEYVPVFRLSNGRHGKPIYIEKVNFKGPCKLIHDIENPLPCGQLSGLKQKTL